MRLFDLTGKIAIVTGSTRGLGRAVAEEFLTAGASVMISSEDATATEQAIRDMTDAGYRQLAGATCDVTDDSQQQALVDATLARFGGIDILVANAGISDDFKGSLVGNDESYDRVMNLNLRSVVRLCTLAALSLKERGGGSIILMSSIAALRGNRGLGPYALAKAGLAQLARNLAVELGPFNIRANAIAPGFIRTDLAKALLADEAFMRRRMQLTPLRRPGEPYEIAGAAVFLASNAGGFVTGHTLVVDGGTLITDGT